MPIPFRRRIPLLAAVALTLLVAAVAFRGWDRYVEDGLGRWAVDELARRTDSTYRLALGDLSFLPLAGSLSFDSMSIVTDSARNKRRPAPLPELRGRAYECRVSGVAVVRLLFRRSFMARELGCVRTTAVIALASRAKTAPAATAADSVVRPLGLSAFRIGAVSFPSLTLAVEGLGRDREGSLVLGHAQFDAADLVLDLTADPRVGRSLSADRATLAARGFVLRTNPRNRITVERVEASLTDSTLLMTEAGREPSVPDAEQSRRQRFRDDVVTFALDSLRARGVAYRDFLATGAVGIRALELSGARLEVLSDKRLPKGRPKPHRTPQQVAARPGQAVRLDTVLVTGGTIIYREREPETDRPGVLSFDAVRGRVLHLDLPSRGKPLRISAAARLMNEGLLAVEATVPLDAPDFRYELSGKLGKMPAKAFNRFLAVNEAFELDGGMVEEVEFRQSVRGSRATTTITPRYRDLSVASADEGGGVLGRVKRAMKEFVAQALVVRSSNPDEDGENLRTARTVRRYDPTTTWIQFVWLGVRDGLMEALKE